MRISGLAMECEVLFRCMQKELDGHAASARGAAVYRSIAGWTVPVLDAFLEGQHLRCGNEIRHSEQSECPQADTVGGGGML